MKALQYKKLLKQLLDICSELTRDTGRPFTLDGFAIGSSGEVWAQWQYGLTLHRPGNPYIDAEWGKYDVQIKTTQHGSIQLTKKSPKDLLLLVLQLQPDGDFKEKYNGEVALLFREKQKSFSLGRLAELNKKAKIKITKK
ncbi:MAG: hypothetical protein QY311_00705 [Candidatus Paceibacterota bacterium]|nr:MAG: hypothetical protein QY311_00705 [Candidatus Paceibacterota bacterium]